MDKEIREFFEERKDAWLKKNLKKGISPEEEQKIQEECEDKFCLDNWLLDAASKAGKLYKYIVTHPSKFSHPDSITTPTIFNGTRKSDGFLRTGNCETEIDACGNAALNSKAIDVYKFLSLKFDDGKTVLEHLEQGTERAKEQFHISTASFEEIQKGFICVKQSGEEAKTSGLVKQVYFPIKHDNSSSDYNLLSILTPSGLVFEMKKRINAMSPFLENNKEARQLKKKEEYSENGFDELFDLTKISYGGTKPQNISVLNSNSGGKVYLLPSLPPLLAKRDVRLPRYDFFQNCLWVNNFKENFEALHKLLIIDYNNINIREGIERKILSIMDKVIEQSWRIRKHGTGWSDSESYSNLPVYQKIWLDDVRIEERKSADSSFSDGILSYGSSSNNWLDKVIEELARWIIQTYRNLYRDSGVNLGDDEILPIKKIIMENKEALL
ncbi:MAG: type I-F CRISPR-associated protein Csy1 [Desulfamplus sp.]|nr:type I-F CRISPR-associated protein Csy1 [Desulfamplus sp.]